MPANKTYQYKVYKPTVTNVTNTIFEGDFEGEVGDWATYWQAYNSGPTLARNRPNAYPSSPLGQAMVFNGSSSYVGIQSSGTGFGDLSSVPYMGICISAYKSNWNSGLREALFSNDYIDPTGAGGQQQMGFGVHINYTSGFLSVLATTLVSGTWTLKEAKYALSSITAGFHFIVAGYDGNNTTLWIDGTQVATVAIGSGSHPLYYGNSGSGYISQVGVGAQRQPDNTSVAVPPTGNWFLGKVNTLSIHTTASGAPVTSAMATDFFTNHTLQTTNVNYAYNFDLNADGLAYDLINATVAQVVNDTYDVGIVELDHSLSFTTSTGGSTTQGIKSTTTGRANIVGGAIYTASCYVLGTVGKTVSLQITPIGGGSAASTSQVLVAGWNKISLTYTFNIAATKAEVDVFLNSASSSIQTVYVDQVMLETGTVSHGFYNRFTPDAVGASYSYDNINRVYNAVFKTLNLVGTWDKDVSTPFQYSQELNGAGGEVSVQLQRLPEAAGEGNDLTLNNLVQVSVVSDTYPNGQVIFKGAISRYQQDYVDNYVVVTLLGYGSEFSDYLYEGAQEPVINQFDTSGNPIYVFASEAFGATYAIGQSFTTKSNQTDVASLDVYLEANLTGPNINPIGQEVVLYIYGSYSDMVSNSNLLSTGRHFLQSATSYWANFLLQDAASLPTPLSVSPSTQYFFKIERYYDFQAPDHYFDVFSSYSAAVLGEQYYTIYNDVMLGDVYTPAPAYQCIAFRVNQSYGQTTVAFTAADPSTMLTAVMDDYTRQGGSITYDSSSIELTGTTVDYTFSVMTTLDCINKILDLCPANWYWYVDQATNKLHLHPVTSALVNTFKVDKHLKSLTFEKKFESLINTVYFTGGALADGINFFKKYQDTNSVAIYGQRLYQYSDTNVIDEDVADTIVASVFTEQDLPTIQTTQHIIEGTYNLESLKVGDLVIFRDFQSSRGSLWDISLWDQDKWDFDITDPQTYRLQIVRIDYDPDAVELTLSTTQPDIAKQVDALKRKVQALINLDNPASPSS